MAILNWTLWLLGTLLVGAIGSGLWSRIGDPLYEKFRNSLLTFSSVLFKRYRDRVYRDISYGRQELPSLYTMQFFCALLAILPPGTLWFIIISAHLHYLNIINPGPGLLSLMNAARTSVDHASLDYQIRHMLLFLYINLIFLSLSSLYIFLIPAVRVNYIHAAVRHYRILCTALAPHTPLLEQQQNDSLFVQIRSKDDYIALISQLEMRATEHGLIFQHFTPW
jgi:hypothetical protein